jgi:6-phospho-beta-glucosidase
MFFMKLALIGGGGIRAPLVIQSALRRAEKIHLDEICLMDNDAEQLELIGGICKLTAQEAGSNVKIRFTTDTREALEGAGYVITTIRVGKEKGRVLDERIALAHHVLGQETTGPGGFAMAMRSIPAILEYAELMYKLAPGAWMFNFTNPAGLVTQAVRDSGFERFIGICDGANQGQHWAAKYYHVQPSQVRAEVFGLNHLSWSRSFKVNGVEKLPELLADDAFLRMSDERVFEPELVRQQGLWMNEYLFYFHYAERAVNSILAEKQTRGEEILHLNRELMDKLSEINPAQFPREAMQTYWAYNERRGATYMNYANPNGPSIEQAEHQEYQGSEDNTFSEGYAGVALGIVEAFESGIPVHMAMNVPNGGAIDCMRPTDVVEISCDVDRDGIHPLKIGAIPEPQELLMRSVKRYERLAVEAILTRNRKVAYQALMAHPLVLSYSLARTLVDEYLQAHAPYVGEWK